MTSPSQRILTTHSSIHAAVQELWELFTSSVSDNGECHHLRLKSKMVERSAQYVRTIVYSDARCELCKSDYPYEVTGPDKHVYKLIEYEKY